MISIMIDSELAQYAREIKHTFGFIFQSLGYNHRTISNPDQLRHNDILIIYSLSQPALEYLEAIAQHYVLIHIIADPKLFDYRAMSPDQLRRYIREIKLLTMTPVISERKFDLPAEHISDPLAQFGKINFDVIGNAFFHLAELEPLIDKHRDANGYFPDEASAFYQWRDFPYVESMLWLIDSLIKELCRVKKQYLVQKAYYPEGQQACVMLTHSVDKLQKWDFNRIVLSTVDDLVMLFTFKWQQLFRNIGSKMRYLFTNYEMYWNFDEYRTLERDFNQKSTYFFAAEPGADVDYHLDDTDLQEEIAGILREGHEIGLLATEDKLNRDDFVARKQILLQQIHRSELGIRQSHYLQNDTIQDLHQKLSPRFGSSTSFKETPGYKKGIACPHYAWVNSLKSTFLEIPVVYRESFLRINKYRHISLEDAKQQIKKYFHSTTRIRGVFCIDFTISGFTDTPYCKKLYEYILALLKTAKLWQTTGLELATWWEKRARVVIEEGEYEIGINFPDDLGHFVLQTFNDVRIKEIVGSPASIDGNLIKFSNIKADSYAVIRIQQEQ